jgi:hypothetical protein
MLEGGIVSPMPIAPQIWLRIKVVSYIACLNIYEYQHDIHQIDVNHPVWIILGQKT